MRRRGMTRGWQGKRREELLTGTALSGLECLGGLEVGGGARALEARAGGLLELRVAAEAAHVEAVVKGDVSDTVTRRAAETLGRGGQVGEGERRNTKMRREQEGGGGEEKNDERKTESGSKSTKRRERRVYIRVAAAVSRGCLRNAAKNAGRDSAGGGGGGTARSRGLGVHAGDSSDNGESNSVELHLGWCASWYWFVNREWS